MRTRGTVLIACALLLAAACALLALLNHAKLASTFEQRSRDRHATTARDTARALEAQLALGLALADTPAVRTLLERTAAHGRDVLGIAVLDARGATVLAVGSGTPERWRTARLAPPKGGLGYLRDGDVATIAIGLRNAFEVQAGWLVVEYRLDDARANTARAFNDLWPAGLAATALALAMLALSGRRLVGLEPDGTLAADQRRLVVALTVAVLAVQGAFATASYRSFSRIAADDAPALAATLARTVEPTLQRALGHGIPLQELRGVEEWLAAELASSPEFSGLDVLDAAGSVLYRTRIADREQTAPTRYQVAIEHAGATVGTLVVSLDAEAVSERVRQLAIEFVTLLLAGALLIHEALKAIAAPRRPVGSDSAVALRLPLFLFFIGSELPRSFLPIWANDLAAQPLPPAWSASLPDAWLAPLASVSPTVLATVPISVFLLAVALSSPFAGRYCARHGPRRLLLLGTALGMAGHLLAMVADSLALLCVARVVAGTSFGAVSLAAFDYIGRLGGGRASGMALYLGAYVSAGIAGAGIGALLVDRAGIPAVFGFGVTCSVLGMIVLRGFPATGVREHVARPLAGALASLLRTPAFARMLLLVALPLQIVQQGLLFYWAPLALVSLGERTSVVGLAMMGYFSMVLLLNGPLARHADRRDRHDTLIAGGLGLAALVGLADAAALFGLADAHAEAPAAVTIVAGVVAIGIAWAMAFPSQGAVALRLAQTGLPGVDPAVSIGVYRTIERIGAMLAPIVVALLIVAFGYAGSAGVMGGVLLVCALAHWAMSTRNKT
jgi:MFS family permease